MMLRLMMSRLKPLLLLINCGLMERYNDPAKSKPLGPALPIMKRAVMTGRVVPGPEVEPTG